MNGWLNLKLIREKQPNNDENKNQTDQSAIWIGQSLATAMAMAIRLDNNLDY